MDFPLQYKYSRSSRLHLVNLDAMVRSHAQDLIAKVRSSSSILVVVGAGLSRPSGLPTFREDAEFWGQPIEEVASYSAFMRNPSLVWRLYEQFRQLSIHCVPNAGHFALAKLAREKPGLLVVSQNIDGKCFYFGFLRK